jgi:hypothetical protein
MTEFDKYSRRGEARERKGPAGAQESAQLSDMECCSKID